MNNVRLTSEDSRGKHILQLPCSFSGVFLVLFQAPIVKVPEVITQVFRPLIVFFLMIRMAQRGKIDFSARTIALIAAIYCMFDLLIVKINGSEIMNAGAVILYLLMFCAITGTPWNKREIRFIILACFLGAFACAVAIFMSNDPTDLHVGKNNTMQMLGEYVNRNKNAYAFSIGTIIGVIYLLYGRKVRKFWIAVITAVIAYALLYSQCRGAFLCTVAGVTIAVTGVLLDIKKRNEGKFVGYTFLFIALCIASYLIIKNSELSRLITNDTSGRDDGIGHAWQLFLNSDMFSKIFGHGYAFEAQNTEGVGAHLVYVTYILTIGIIGCALITLMFLRSATRIKGAVPYAFWCCAFLRTFFEGLDYYIYIPLILSLIIYNYTYIYGRNVNELFTRR